MENGCQLVIVNGKFSGDTFAVERGCNLIGRWDPNRRSFPEIDLESYDPDVKVSRKHAMVRLNDGELEIEDLGSLNGTYLNRELLEPGEKRVVGPGDEIVIGPIVFRLQDDI
jgi:pSer/pThr/pTyr-binding forkhead associated (FHA) protein